MEVQRNWFSTFQEKINEGVAVQLNAEWSKKTLKTEPFDLVMIELETHWQKPSDRGIRTEGAASLAPQPPTFSYCSFF